MDPTTTETVQPDPGQGGASEGTPYSEYLDRIPAELRDQVEPVFKSWDSNVTRRFQELSSAGRRWEPFEQAGLHQYDPQSLQQLVEFAQMAESNPEAYTSWLREQASAAGLLSTQQDEDTYIDPAIEKLVEQRFEKQFGPLQQQVQQFQSWQQQQEMARAQQQHTEQINTRLDELARQHGEFPRPAVEKFISNYIDSDPQNAVDRAFGDYQQLVADIEKQVFASKLSQPGTPETSGTPDAHAQPITSLRDAAAIATERLRQQNNS